MIKIAHLHTDKIDLKRKLITNILDYFSFSDSKNLFNNNMEIGNIIVNVHHITIQKCLGPLSPNRIQF